MRDPISSEPTGIQRTALNPDGTKIGRMMLGPAGVVQLWPAAETLVDWRRAGDRAAPRRPPRPSTVNLCNQPGRRCGALARFPMINIPGRLIMLLADNDRNNAGQIAAAAPMQRWRDAGRRSAVLTPSEPGTDFSNVILAMRRMAHD